MKYLHIRVGSRAGAYLSQRKRRVKGERPSLWYYVAYSRVVRHNALLSCSLKYALLK